MSALAVVAGSSYSCALLLDGTVKCWGWNSVGQLGQGDTDDRSDGPGEMGDNLPAIDLGTDRTAVAIAVGSSHVCVVLDNGTVKCWGSNSSGQLGQGDTDHRGDDAGEMGDNLQAIDLGTGRTAVAVATGAAQSCVLLDNGTVKCWGANGSGQLGQGNTTVRGDDPGEMGDNLPAIDLGTNRTADGLVAGWMHVCARLDNQSVKCWGENGTGQLGQESTTDLGDGPAEMGDNLPEIDLGSF